MDYEVRRAEFEDRESLHEEVRRYFAEQGLRPPDGNNFTRAIVSSELATAVVTRDGDNFMTEISIATANPKFFGEFKERFPTIDLR